MPEQPDKVAPRNPNPVVYPAVAQCIYCGKASGDLTDEHIIPFSLGGLLLLPKASCSACAKITCSIEGAVARSIFGNFRLKHNLPTRRKKERPNHIKAGNAANTQINMDVPVSEHPAPLFMLKCSRAGILEGLPKSVDTSGGWKFVGIVDNEKMSEFQDKYGKEVTFEFRHVPDQFSRTLAKIGYSYAVANLGVEGFTALAPDFILGKDKNRSYLVGGDPEIPPPIPDAGHILQLALAGDENQVFVIVEIRLFASCPTPQYHVVVGEIAGKSNISKTIDRLSTISL